MSRLNCLLTRAIETYLTQKTAQQIPYYNIAVILIEELRAQRHSAEEALILKEKINSGKMCLQFFLNIFFLYSELLEKNQALEEKMQLIVKETNEKVVMNLKRQHQQELDLLIERVIINLVL